MAAPENKSHQPARRWRRWLAGGVAALLLLCVLALAAAWWWAGRPQTLQWVFAQVEASVGGKLTVTGARGSLLSGIDFDRLEYDNATQHVVVEQGSATWRYDPVGRRLTIAHLGAQRVTVISTPTGKPLAEPASLSLPLEGLRVEALDIRELVVQQAGSDPRVVGPLSAGFAYANQVWQIERLRIASTLGTLQGRGSLNAQRPFALAAELQIDGEYQTGERALALQAPVKLQGTLGAFDASSHFVFDRLPGDLTARLRSFADLPLERATLHWSGVSPQRWNPQWPAADLTVDAWVAPVADANSPGQAAGQVQGHLRVVNSKPGVIDAGAVPLVSAQADFSGSASDASFSKLEADLGAGGRLTGTARWHDGTPQLKADVRALDLHALHSRLITTRLNGPISLTREGATLHLDAAVSEAGRSASFKLTQTGNDIQLRDARIAVGASRFNGAGSYDLGGRHAFAANGTVEHLDPRAFGNFARGDLNGTIRLDGALLPAWSVAVDARFAASRIADRAFDGSLKAKAAPQRVQDVAAALNFGANKLFAEGSFGRSGDRLAWRVTAPRLADLGSDFAGSLNAQGSASGSFDVPAVDFTLSADDLRLFGKHRIQSLRGQGQLLAGATGTLDASLSLTNYRNGIDHDSPTLASADLQFKGTRSDHHIVLAARNDQLVLSAEAQGGLGDDGVWKGNLQKLANRGRIPFTLRGDAALIAGAERIQLEHAGIDLTEGRIDLAQLSMAGGTTRVAGTAQGVPLAMANLFVRDFSKRVETDLKLGGEWDVGVNDAGNGTINGQVHVFRERGGVIFRADAEAGLPALNVALDGLDARATVVDNRIDARLDTAGRGLGEIHFTGGTRLSRRALLSSASSGFAWGVAGDAPLTLTGNVDVPDMRWMSRLSGRAGLELSGRLRMQVNAKGSVAQPVLAGSASGSGVGLHWPDQGVNFKDGSFETDFEGDRIVLKSLQLKAGKGSVDATGSLRLAGAQSTGKMDFRIDHFEAISRPDRLVIASGTGSVELLSGGLMLSAKLKADRGLLQLTDKSGPTVSDDVVVIGRPVEEVAEARSLPVRFDVRFDVGDDFSVKGVGFEGKLGGAMQVAGNAAAPRALGTIQVRDGTYFAYSQRLTIERGALTFSGPLDNPALDIFAVRKGLAVEAGVEIRGTALAPQARLVSNPNVPDTEKLSWLVLGHGLDASRQSDFGLLTTAASGLLGSSESAGLQSRIASRLGVDNFGVSGIGGAQGGLITIGKQISSRVNVSFEQGLLKAATLLKIRYSITQRVSVQVQTGTENAADLFYTFQFD